ncbi:MAG: hypothetical protein GY720_15110 [bacterium]|nr:hypothetical protein [bacterium]
MDELVYRTIGLSGRWIADRQFGEHTTALLKIVLEAGSGIRTIGHGHETIESELDHRTQHRNEPNQILERRVEEPNRHRSSIERFTEKRWWLARKVLETGYRDVPRLAGEQGPGEFERKVGVDMAVEVLDGKDQACVLAVAAR